jgi:hypothetical protein
MKAKQYVLREFGSGWTAEQISTELSKLATKGMLVEHFEVTPCRLEVSREVDPLPGLNDGDTVAIDHTIRVLLARAG